MIGKFRSHCNRGHHLEGDNLGIWGDGKRYCKTCKRERDRINHRKHKKVLNPPKRFVWESGVDAVCAEFLRRPVVALRRGEF